MLRITCPLCGTRDYTEYRYGGDARKKRPEHDAVGQRVWHDYVFLFDNIKGLHGEFWQHIVGCRQWLIVERDTAANVVFGVVLARTKHEVVREEIN
jgi:heterotetrameric sarcosine oxidase delta subunit